MPNLWQTIASVPGLAAVPAEWQRLSGDEFGALKSFLNVTPRTAESFPCPDDGCAHRIVPHPDGTAVGVCECECCDCDNLALTLADVSIWELNRAKFGRAICRAFECDPRATNLHLPATWQIGVKFADAVPVILTIQNERREFSRVVAELVGRQRERFILLAPTGRFMDGPCKELLHNAKAGLFDLESNLVVTPQGNLQSRKAPGELFATFAPDVGEPVDEDVARKVFALVKQLESETSWRKAPILQVFRLYCMENLSRDQIAKRCACAPSLVSLRLKQIEKKLGRKPTELRQFSSHFEDIEESLSDPRARRIHRRGLVDGTDEDEWE